MLAYSRTNDAEMAFLAPAHTWVRPIRALTALLRLERGPLFLQLRALSAPEWARTVARTEFVYAA